MIHATEKSLVDLGDQVEAEDKSNIEAAIAALKTAMESNDKADIESKTQVLAEASGKLAEKAYAANSEDGPGPVDANASAESGDSNDDVVDAEFEEVEDDKK
jgi:molecular chaperone DnaK